MSTIAADPPSEARSAATETRFQLRTASARVGSCLPFAVVVFGAILRRLI
jgi:hypothetical protein